MRSQGYVAEFCCVPFVEDAVGAGGERVFERAGETLGEARVFLVFCIFFGGLASEDDDDDDDELDESLELH